MLCKRAKSSQSSEIKNQHFPNAKIIPKPRSNASEHIRFEQKFSHELVRIFSCLKINTPDAIKLSAASLMKQLQKRESTREQYQFEENFLELRDKRKLKWREKFSQRSLNRTKVSRSFPSPFDGKLCAQ